MKISYVNTEFYPVPPVRGGAVEEWIEQSARRLKGHEISIFSIHHEALEETPEQNGHIRYHWYRRGWLARILMSTYKLPFKNPESKFFYFPYSYWCARTIRKLKADIIHVHNRPHFVWILRKLNPKAKIILHFHQVSAMEGKPALNPRLIKETDLFMGCSRFITEEVSRRFGVAPDKTAVAYNALEWSSFPHGEDRASRRKQTRWQMDIKEEEVVLLYSGRLAKNKGVHLLINAANLLIKDGFNIKVIICGAAGYSTQRMTSYIQKLHNLAYINHDRFLFTGFVEHKKIADYYLAADLVVIPSEVDEGFCVVTIEALACGVPVVASKRGGIPEIIKEGKTGALAEGPTLDSLTSRIKEFFLDREKFRLMAEEGQSMVRDSFTWDAVCNPLFERYKSLVKER